jgi:polyferredoxin
MKNEAQRTFLSEGGQAPERGRRSPLAAFLICLPMMVLTFMMLFGRQRPVGAMQDIAFAATFVFFNLMFFLMVYRQRTERYRAVLFIVYAVAFVISFISQMVELRGTMALTQANILRAEAPFCHIAIPMTLIPAALNKTLVFPASIAGRLHSAAGMFIIWIGASLALGRGFCGWGCFFGGLEDGFSRIFKRPLLKLTGGPWRYLPYAVLLVVVLTAAASLSPTYCTWLCPFKAVTEYVQVTSLTTLIQMIIFISLFAGLVVILPILTKRRTQCALFCPFGAFQSFTNKASGCGIRADKDKCVKCGLCARNCPTFSIDAESIEAGGSRLTCLKCGKCVDLCPKGALSYHVKGAAPAAKSDVQRLLFIYPAFLFLATMGGAMVSDALFRIVRLVATGHMIG